MCVSRCATGVQQRLFVVLLIEGEGAEGSWVFGWFEWLVGGWLARLLSCPQLDKEEVFCRVGSDAVAVAVEGQGGEGQCTFA